MKISNYLYDKLISIITYLFMMIIIVLMLLAFNSPKELTIAITLCLSVAGLIILIYNYLRKKYFYDYLITNLKQLDKKYLITELLPDANFLEGKYLKETMYETNKSMVEHINKYKYSIEDFREYIELWIHEVKIPISSIKLILHNHKLPVESKLLDQINRIENDVEQVLYYTRSKNAERDYLIKECNLKEVVNRVIIKNKDIFISQKIKIEQNNLDLTVLSDSKWLEYIINQIISNSLKYSNKSNSKVIISAICHNQKTKLIIEDNGLGINKKDLSRIFDKTFTGENGRKIASSTGMGLYIVSSLIKKLNHKIEVESEENKFTRVIITFTEGEYYDVLK